MRIVTNPAERHFHGYAGTAPIYVSPGRDLLVDRFIDDAPGHVRVCASVASSVAVRLADADARNMATAVLGQVPRPAGISPVELSVLIGRHAPVEIDVCRVCGHEMTISSMGSGEATKYRCGSPEASVIRQPGGIWSAEAEAASDHARRSEVCVSYHGDSTIVAVLHELRRVRTLLGEDLTVPVGAVHFPDGHGKSYCYRFLRHLGDDRWEQVVDFEYTHDPGHATLEPPEGS